MPSGDLPNMNSDEPGYIELGGLLRLMGGLAVIPAAKLVRRPQEAKFMSKRRRKKKWRWVILGIPIFIFLIGAGIVLYFGVDMTKQTVLLVHTAVTRHKPDLLINNLTRHGPSFQIPGHLLGN